MYDYELYYANYVNIAYECILLRLGAALQKEFYLLAIFIGFKLSSKVWNS